MKQVLISALLILLALPLFAQDTDEAPFRLTGNLNAIYTFGIAGRDQMLATGTGDGAYEEYKNGYFIETNLYAMFKPVSFIEGYFKLYTIARPGSFYVPLSLEPKSDQNFGVSLDRVYGRVNVFEALSLSLPVDLYFKTGKYKGESARYQNFSKFGLENVLSRMESANTYNYELEVALRPLNDDFTISAAFIGNYRFDESIPRLYDVDGAVSDHGAPVLGEYAPQFMAYIRTWNLDLGGGHFSGELIYGQNVSDIYSGNSIGAAFRYNLPAIPDTLSIPIGLGFVWHEKNIDLLSNSASNSQGRETIDFRSTIGGALSLGARFNSGDIRIDGNLAGVFTLIEHIYRDPLQIISLSFDLEFAYDRVFLGCGFIAGSLTDARWQTKPDTATTNYGALDGGGYDRTFTFADNMGYEVYLGLNLFRNCRLIIGFNQNKGIAMNYGLESKAEGQMKYQLADSDLPGSYETGGVFMKFAVSW
jgi:hypothetical protein